MIYPEFRFVEIGYSISKAGLNVKRHKKETSLNLFISKKKRKRIGANKRP